jgi:cell division GTPase FtsZ
MKLLVIGFGQCGGRVADEFARLGIRARLERGIDIITGAFAVNTDVADLSGLSTIRPDYQHRVLIGGQRTGGRGVGKINELGAEIAREDGDKIIDAMRTTQRLAETDAILLVASAAGGTGSGAIATVTQRLKQRYIEKPLYNLIVLPFRHEEEVEGRTIYNSATCLKSAYLAADAVILVDNERYVSKTTSIRSNLTKINALIVEPFYNVLCAGEEKKPRYIGARILDGGDIIQTLAGWTVIGHSKSRKPRVKNPFDFRDKMTESQRGVQVMNNALAELSLNCNPKDAGRGLYLISASPKEMEMNLVSDLGAHLKRLAPEAIIRTGDYPRGDGTLTVTVILSELSGVSKLVSYFTHTIELLSIIKKRREGIELEHRDLREAFRDIPTLL